MDKLQEFKRLKTDLLQKTMAYAEVLQNMSYNDISNSAKRIELSSLHSAALTSYTNFGTFIYDTITFEDGNDDLIPLQ